MIAVKLVAIIALVSLMLDAGLHANAKTLMATLRDWRMLARTCLANFVVVPLVGYLVVHGLQLETFIGVGILWMAIAPGVPFVARTAGKAAGGNEDLAVDLTFVLPLLSVVTIPITAQLLLPHAGEAHVPMGLFVTKLLVFQLLPLIIGLVLAQRAPALSQTLKRPLAILVFAAVVALLVMLAPSLVRAVGAIQGSRGILAMMLIVFASLAAGWLLGGDPLENRHTLSVATALRNIGFCMTIAASYPRTTVASSVMTYFLVQFILVFVFSTGYRRSTRRTHAHA
ncbi:MAG: bile acid:sodium symporter [Deltaproteobacteria bacterium]|nr:bile acid:sodium symporter [Deltaproteobacteria bacterium]